MNSLAPSVPRGTQHPNTPAGLHAPLNSPSSAAPHSASHPLSLASTVESLLTYTGCALLACFTLSSTASASENVHRRLTFTSLPSADVLTANGVEPVALVEAGHTILARVPEGFSTAIASGAFASLIEVAPIPSQGKLSPSVENLMSQAHGPVTLLVRGYAGIDFARFHSELSFLTDGTVSDHSCLPANVLVVTASPKQFQRMLELDTVLDCIEAPDEIHTGRRFFYCPGRLTEYGAAQRFNTQSEGWDGPGKGCVQLSYHFLNGTPDLGLAQQRDIIRAAMLEWTTAGDIQFNETSGRNQLASIDIGFVPGSPGDNISNSFGDATIEMEPRAGNMFFNEEEDWSVGSGEDLFSVTLHELGHVLGLAHSNTSGSVMRDTFPVVTGIHQDDMNGIQQIYSNTAPIFQNTWMNEPLDFSVEQVTDEIALSTINSDVFYNHGGQMFRFYEDGSGGWLHEVLVDSITNVAGDLATAWNSSNVYYRGTDGRLWNFHENSTGWHAGPLSSSITNVAGDITASLTDSSVYYRGTDGGMWRFWWAQGWQNERLTNDVNNVAGNIAVTNSGSNVYYTDSSNRMWNFYRPGGTGAWANGILSWSVNNVAGDVVTSSIGSNVYYRGDDHRMWNFYHSGGWQNAPLSWAVVNVEGNLTTGPNESGSNVFYSDDNGRMWNFYRSNGSWANDILRWDVDNVEGPAKARKGSVFYRGTDDRMWRFFFEESCPRGVN